MLDDLTLVTQGSQTGSSVSTTNYTAYDAFGRVTSSNQVTDSQTYSMSYAYNLAGSQTSMTYPSGRVITSGYDSAGRLAGVKDQSSGVYYAGAASTDATNRVQYAAQGVVSVMKLGNGLWEHTSFNNRLQPTQIGLGTSSTDSGTMGLSYNYGTTTNNGNLQSVSYSGGGLSYTQSFGYDALNRLTTSSESGSSWSQTNGYDQYGNRWIDYGGGVHNLAFSATTNRITTSGYSYDSAGNLTNDTVHTYGFDAENKIKTVDGVTGVYGYDGDGNRVKKNFALGEKVRMVYSGGQLVAEYNLTTGALLKEYVYGAKGLVATIEPTNGTRYTTSDHLGSPRVVTNSSAGVVSRHDYLPFGEELFSGTGGRTTAQGYSGNDGIRQQFTGQQRDNETGLDYFNARYYASMQGRFTSPDPLVASGHPMNPQSWNRYAYVSNNPCRLVDPSGLAEEDSEDQQKQAQQQQAQKQTAINDQLNQIRNDAKPLKAGEKPVPTDMKYLQGEQINHEGDKVLNPDGTTNLEPAYGTAAVNAVVVLDQGGNIMGPENNLTLMENVTATSEDARGNKDVKTSNGLLMTQNADGTFYDRVGLVERTKADLDAKNSQPYNIELRQRLYVRAEGQRAPALYMENTHNMTRSKATTSTIGKAKPWGK